MQKIAASKLRTLMALGELNPARVKQLQERGMLPSIFRLMRGVNRGNKNIASKFDVQNFTTDSTGWFMRPTPPGAYKGPKAEYPIALAGGFAPRYEDPANPVIKSIIATEPATNLIEALQTLPGRKLSPSNFAFIRKHPRITNILFRRHESEEVLSSLAKGKKIYGKAFNPRGIPFSNTDSAFAQQIALYRSGPKFLGGHMSPRVLERESRVLQYMPPELRALLINTRRAEFKNATPIEQAQYRNFAKPYRDFLPQAPSDLAPKDAAYVSKIRSLLQNMRQQLQESSKNSS